MKLLCMTGHNFGSYKKIEFNFEHNGLYLISGPTGAGKSTLMDLVPWALFGITAKNGSVDEIRSWNESEPTKVTLSLELRPDERILITRVRGTASQNDLSWSEMHESAQRRGTDIKDTQKLLEQRLGISAELYMTAAYFNEFSSTGTFFTDKKSKKRELFETLADLSLPIFLKEKASEEKTKETKVLEQLKTDSAIYTDRLKQLLSTKIRLEERLHNYEADRISRIANLKHKIETIEEANKAEKKKFERRLEDIKNKEALLESKKKELDLVKEKCPTCGQPNKEYMDKVLEINQQAAALKFSKTSTFQTIQSSPYEEQIEELKKAENTYMSQIQDIICDIFITESLVEELKYSIVKSENRILGLTQLNKLFFDLRGVVLVRSINSIQDLTNSYIDKYFDGEIKVSLSLEDSDNLDVRIQKNGHQCSYTQLSRGQRSILKLCFAVSVMEAAANKAAINFSILFFDEVLDGLSSDLKIKAVSLFQELETRHSSIIIIDHATEIQNYFSSRFLVTLTSDKSTIKEI